MTFTIDEPAEIAKPAPRRRTRPQITADRLREMILQEGLAPGDRLPSDWLQHESHGVSRGTFREAMKILETQGLVTSKTGPGGGVFITEVDPGEAMRLLDNLFLFEQPTISDIYALRKLLEPQLAAHVAGRLTPEAIEQLQATIRLYEDEPQSAEEEYAQRLAELDFHDVLAKHCENRLLGFVCAFLLSLLREMTVCRDIYAESNPHLRETGLNYQVRLMRAIKAGDAERAREIMRAHMVEAEAYMLERAAMRTRRGAP